MAQGRRKAADTTEPPATRLATLRANEETLRRHLATAEPQHVAAIARELRQTVAEIDEVERQAPPEVSLSDQLAAKRAAKLGASNRASADRRGQPRRSGRSG